MGHAAMSEQYVVDLHDVDATRVALAGGKGAQLGELTRIDGIRVPPGFCVTTDAYRRVMADTPEIGDLIDRLSRLAADDRDAIRTLSAGIRRAIEDAAVPADVAAAITGAVTEDAYAVRSSATAEDLPTASFAGQQDSFLDVSGPAAVLEHVRRCWASLFTERAVTYRTHHDIDHRTVRMAVVVQRMVPARASGVLFTADPLTGDRTVSIVDAVTGLGDALVAGLVTPDVYRVRDAQVIARTLAGPAALTGPQVLALTRLGRRIEAHAGRPQDIEWCLDDDGFQIVQTRPITTLFPVPAAGDHEKHVYVSVGHQQMMTDAMKPLGFSCWQLTAMAPMHEAGGRLFVDVTRALAAPAGRAGLLEVMGRGDPLVRDALETLLDRGDVVTPLPDGPARPPGAGAATPIGTDPAIVAGLVARSQESVDTLRRDIRGRTGPDLFDVLLAAFEQHKRELADPLSIQAIMAGMDATWWLNDKLQDWLGEKNAADTLTLSAPGNITSEMGLALLDVADAIRPYPQVVTLLQKAGPLTELPGLEGGAEALKAIDAYLDRYGMRCAGEIDITRPRWREQPTTLLPMILDNVRNFPPGAAAERFDQGRQRARAKEQDILTRLRALPDGEHKADETQKMIDRVRTFIGYREYPKYWIISRYFVYKQAMLAEAGRLVARGVLTDAEDIFFLTFAELHDVVRTDRVDQRLIQDRKDTYRWHRTLTPPRVLTSDGETLNGAYRRDDAPAGALVGLPVSAGTVEGRARVVLDLAGADLEPGDILVTTYTDPSWSPLFVGLTALVTEVGGLMTHGAVIAREYGLPAVVGVHDATRLIRDGQRIRVHGTDGYIEILR
ncbi:rifamycin-inactivating phosphotransferase [Actinoplanes sp. NPDC051494]|uniref:rifamycin-inactivating phosphotransferase n=1 Tax=Actinoplanes sp. NPDC051494 TaxID=3363907 RepID=UPI0037ADDB0D